MTEAFLHYIWQYRLFDSNNLRTDEGSIIEIVRPGQYNTGAGPDFFNAQLRIDGTLWAGNVEIHIHASDWHRHNHQKDPSYDSCILHVVNENDANTLRMNGTRIPSIELKNKYPAYLWDNYLRLIGSKGWVSCQPRIKETDASTWKITKEKMIIERLEQRTQHIFISLAGNKEDWEECFYQYLAKNFGFQLNAMPFEMLARSLPLKYIKKERDHLCDIEALLFGQAGMLNGKFNEEYPQKLKEIYSHLSKKYSLKNIPFSSWKLLRLRPVNFPALRLAQFAALLNDRPTLFSDLAEANSLKKITTSLEVEASEYWNTHYHFNKVSSFKNKKLGIFSINNIIINTCIPFIYAWGKYIGNIELTERAISFLHQLPVEENHLIKRWEEVGVEAHSAFDSQALIQLKIVHCSEKKCLTCNIGNSLINVLP